MSRNRQPTSYEEIRARKEFHITKSYLLSFQSFYFSLGEVCNPYLYNTLPKSVLSFLCLSVLSYHLNRSPGLLAWPWNFHKLNL